MTDAVDVKFGGSTGDLDAAAAKAQADIEGVSAAAKKAGGGFDALNSTNKQVAEGFKLTGYQAQILSYQMNDVFSGLLTGQKPFQILMQQGPQITQIFGGVRGTFTALRASLTPAVISMGLAAGATIGLVGAGVMLYSAWRNAEASAQAINGAVNGVGRTAGLTAEQVMDAAQSGAEAGRITEAAAEQQAIAYARTGKIGAENMQTLISIGRDYAAMMGMEAEEATKSLADAMEDPIEAGKEMTRQFGLLDQKTLELIKTQVEQGNQSAAQKILLDELTEAVTGQAQEIDEITSAWDAAARAVSNYWKRLGEALHTTPDERVANAQRAVEIAYHNQANGAPMPTGYIEGLMRTRDRLVEEQRVRREAAAAAQRQAAANQAAQEKADEEEEKRTNRRTRRPRADNSAQRAADEAQRILLASLDREQAAVEDNYEAWLAIQDRKIEAVRAHSGEESTEYIRALQAREEYQRQHQEKLDREADREAERVRKAAEDRLETVARTNTLIQQTDQELAEARMEQERQVVDDMFANGEINAMQRMEMLNGIANRETELRAQTAERILAIEVEALRARLALGGLESDEIARINNDIEALEAQHQQNLRVIRGQGEGEVANNTRQAAQTIRSEWQANVGTIAGSFTSMFTQWGAGISSLQEGWQNFGRSLLSTIENYASQMLTQWIMTQLGMTTATATGEAAQTAIVATSTATKTGIVQGGALAEIAAKAASAAAGAYSAIAGIPIIGPFLAPVMAAAALAGVLALGSKIFSAEGGWGKVPYDGAMTELHKDEMVLPASIANPLRSALWGVPGSASASAPGQAAEFQAGQAASNESFFGSLARSGNSLSVSAIDANGVRKFLERHAGEIVKVLSGEARSFNTGGA